LVVSQEMINAYAELTGADYWIHVDVARSRNESPFGATIAHGLLMVSLVSRMDLPSRPEIVGHAAMTFYGITKLRFPAAVRAGASVQGRSRLAGVEQRSAGTLVTTDVQIRVVGFDRPAVVYGMQVLYMPGGVR
jgi:uncharacterized protein